MFSMEINICEAYGTIQYSGYEFEFYNQIF